GGVPVTVLADERTGYRVSVADLEAARTDRTQVLLFVSPSNPTGAVYPPDHPDRRGLPAGPGGRDRPVGGGARAVGDHRRDLRAPGLRRRPVLQHAGTGTGAGWHLRGAQWGSQDLRDDWLAGRLDDRPPG